MHSHVDIHRVNDYSAIGSIHQFLQKDVEPPKRHALQ